jgi:hypothetical protein
MAGETTGEINDLNYSKRGAGMLFERLEAVREEDGG